MNIHEWAQRLDGRQYRDELTSAEQTAAKESGIVIVFGASDDLMEFRGAINDEVGCYNGGMARLTPAGLLVNECEDGCSYFKRLEENTISVIEAVWDKHGYSWSYRTNIPHAAFDVLEDDDKYCRGIAFVLADVP